MAIVAIKLKIGCSGGISMQNGPILLILFLCWEAKVPAVLSPGLCHPSASPLSASPSAHLHCATTNPLPILSHTGHMSLERIYYTISSFRKSCKEASQGDKALRVKSRFFPTDPKENTPIGT